MGYLFFTSCGDSKKNQGINPVNSTKNIILLADTTKPMSIEIENKGKCTSNFSIKLNSGFYLDENEMIEEIKNMPSEYKGEPLERKAWRYVMENIKFSKSLTSEKWQPSAVLMVNSFGNGLCSDLALLLSQTWKKLGFQSRVWGLDGHVVPEVFANGRWQMYDPSHGIYYINTNKEPAGVEELAQHPEFITNPIERNARNNRSPFSMVIGTSEAMAELYSTASNNSVDSWHDTIPDLNNLMFSLPGGAIMRFPVSNRAIATYKSFILPEYSFLSVNVSSTNVTELEIPLVLYAIEGRGKVLIDSVEFQIGSEELKNYLKNLSVFHQQILFSGEPFNATAYYLINKRNLSFKTKNNLILSGIGTDSLFSKISNPEITEEQSCFSLMDSIIMDQLKTYQDNREKYNKQLAPFRSSAFKIENTIGMANVFIGFDKKLNGSQKKELLSLFEEKTKKILTKVSAKGKHPDKILKLLSDPGVVLVALTYMRYCNEEELMKLFL